MSYMVTRKSDGRVIAELSSPRYIARLHEINRDVYLVEDARTYLERINGEIDAARASGDLACVLRRQEQRVPA